MLDDEDFDTFYASTCRRVVGQVFAMVGDLAEAEDAVAEAYCRAWQRRAKLREYADPEGWVRTVAYRIAVSSWRKAVRRVAAHRRYGEPGELPGADPDHLVLMSALRQLSYDQRRVIVLHHLVGLSLEEISREIDTPIGTVKSRLGRGRRILAGHVSEFANDPTPIRRKGVR